MTTTTTAATLTTQFLNPIQQEAAALARLRQLLQSQAQADYSMLLNATNITPTGPGTPTAGPSATLDIVQGTEGVYKVTLTPVNGFSQDVQITCFLWTGTGSMPAIPYPPPAGLKVFTPFVIPAGSNEGLLYISADKSVPVTKFSGVVIGTAVGATDSKLEWFTLNVRPTM